VAVAVLLVCFMAGSASGQTFLLTPRADTCGQANFTGTPSNWTVGGFFTVVWTANGQASTSAVTLSLYTMAGTLVESGLGGTLALTDLSTLIRIPPGTEPGEYYLQWSWQTTTNCAYVTLNPDPLESVVLYPGVPANKILTTKYDYYELNLTNRNFLWVDFSAPDGVSHPNAYATIVIKEGLLPPYPLRNVYDQIATTATTGSVGLGACNDHGASTGFRIAVFGTDGVDNTTSYTVTATTYDGTVNVGTPLRSDAHAGSRYFRTQAYATFDTPRRVVLEGDNEFTTEFQLATTCDFAAGIIKGQQTGGSTNCIQLGDKPGTKYIMVPPITTAYSISTEDGKCSDTGAGIALAVSLTTMLSLLAFLFLM